MWTAITYFYLQRSEANDGSIAYLFCYGFMLTGFVLIGIGMLVGYIGRAAMRAEVAATPGMMIAPTTAGVIPGVAPAVTTAPNDGLAAAAGVAATNAVPHMPARPVAVSR